jgi:non-homologous end joining protein Ku
MSIFVALLSALLLALAIVHFRTALREVRRYGSLFRAVEQEEPREEPSSVVGLMEDLSKSVEKTRREAEPGSPSERPATRTERRGR